MTHRSALFTFAVAAGLVVAAGGVEGKTAEPAQAWDQAAVTAIASDLAKASAKLYTAFYEQPGPLNDMGDDFDQDRIHNKLIIIEQQTQGLAGALKAGKGRKETTGEFEDIGELWRDLVVLLQRSFQTAPVLAQVQSAQQLWQKLVPYYGVPEPINP